MRVPTAACLRATAFLLAGIGVAHAADFGMCMGALRSEALGRGISSQTFDSAMKGV